MRLNKIICMGFFAASLAACGQANLPSGDIAQSEAKPQSETTSPSEAKSAPSKTGPEETMITQLIWEDLMPEGEEVVLEQLYRDFYNNLEGNIGGAQTLASAAQSSDQSEGLDLSEIIEGSSADTMAQIGTFNVVKDLNGEKIRIPGYVVPLDFSAKSEHSEFLLVPYFGACLHTPPPPPNQIIFVKAAPAVKLGNIYEPIWLEGTIRTGEFNSELGNSAYEVSLSKAEPYEY